MTELKCPFCQQRLRQDQDGYYTCYTDNCGCMKYGGNGASGSESLWLALIRTRKALGVAVDALKSAKKRFELINNSKFANLNNVLQIQSQCEVLKIDGALEQITALEQKDGK